MNIEDETEYWNHIAEEMVRVGTIELWRVEEEIDSEWVYLGEFSRIEDAENFVRCLQIMYRQIHSPSLAHDLRITRVGGQP